VTARDLGEEGLGRYLSRARNRAKLNVKKMCTVSICDDENVLEVNSGDGTQHCECTYKESFLLCVLY